MKTFLVSILAFVCIGIATMTLLSASHVYQGKEIFRTETEYTQFKEAVGSSDVEIIDLTVLSSEPPIVVDYRIAVNDNEIFNYGELDKSHMTPVMILYGMGGILVITAIVTYIVELKQSNDEVV